MDRKSLSLHHKPPYFPSYLGSEGEDTGFRKKPLGSLLEALKPVYRCFISTPLFGVL
jgi:hypothetical protein